VSQSYTNVPLPLEGLPTIEEVCTAVTEEAIALVDAHAQPGWKTSALHAIETLASYQPDLTTDDVWHYLRAHDLAGGTHEKRAMGAVMRAASAAGMIERTANHRESNRPECHKNPKRVWRSLLHSGPTVRLASA
jgi:hypothetical protein